MSLTGVTDKRVTQGNKNRRQGPVGKIVFTANAGGSTTTIVGANATPSTNTNVVRVGEFVKIYNAAGNPKSDTVHKVTAVAVAASTTVTFSPAASAATVSTDTLRLVTVDQIADSESMDDRLAELDGTTYTATYLSRMTLNDKLHAIRTLSDPGGVG